jgi:hypothetical protein
MSPEKVHTIKTWAPLRSVKHVQQFLGFANFYRRFIEGFSKVARPLTELKKKDKHGQNAKNVQNARNARTPRTPRTPVLYGRTSANRRSIG